jgi:hypothetical protein
MDRKRNKQLLPVLSIIALLAAACPYYSSADQYTYSDGFSTDKAMTDSYEHSEFLEDLPDPWPLDGFLRYEPYGSDRMLTFYYGSGYDSYAWLEYELPLDGGSSGVEFTSAVVELELVNAWEGGFIQCGCSFLDAPPWEWPVASSVGTHTLEFVGSEPTEAVRIEFRGCDASIDDLAITLQQPTPVEACSWARIKCLFGGPPN